jgi:hypothetical protein
MADAFPHDPAAPRRDVMGASGARVGWVRDDMPRPAQAVYTGTLANAVEVLITIWGDESAEIAMRLTPSDTWSPPEPLTRSAS